MKPFAWPHMAALAVTAALWLGWPQQRDKIDSAATATKPAPGKAISGWKSGGRESLDRVSLASLASFLRDLPRAEAVATITDFLSTGTDGKTALAFEISAGNRITGWPTLRTFLIDLLLEIDPAAAAEASRAILATSTTADEWAIALRNLARAERFR